MINKRKSKNQRNYVGITFILASFAAFYASYFNLYVAVKCSYGGSKLSWLFGMVCESLGKTGASILWSAIGFFIFGVGSLLLFRRY